MMHWLYLLLALVLFVARMRGWYLDRIGGQPQRDESAIIDPLELRKLREQAAARKRELAASQAQDPGPPPA